MVLGAFMDSGRIITVGLLFNWVDRWLIRGGHMVGVREHDSNGEKSFDEEL
jgi:hypothetical protein